MVHVYNKEVQQRRSMQEELHLFARLSHEIRTPITAIVGLSEVMMHDTSWWPSLTAEQKCTVSDLAASARRLRSVVNDLLVFSSSANVEGSVPSCQSVTSPRTGYDDEESVNFNIREVVDTVVGYCLPQAEQAGLQVYADIPPSMPWEVAGERARLLCILDHLVSNAVKFTPAGSVTIKVAHLQFSHSADVTVSPLLFSFFFAFRAGSIGR